MKTLGMNGLQPSERRTRRKAALILSGIAACEAIPLVLSIHGITRLFAHPQSAPAIAGALVVAGLFVAYSLREPGIRRHVGDRSWLRIPAIATAVVAGIVEEVYFRRVLMDALDAHGVATVLQILASGALFGILHGVWGLWGGRQVVAGAVGATSALGIGLAVLYVATGRALLPCIEAHILIDLVLEPALVLYALDSARPRVPDAARTREARRGG